MAGSQPPSTGVAPPPPPDPLQQVEAQLQALQAKPTWEDAISLMRQDGPRGFRVDIETDSTIAADQVEEQQAITQLLSGVTTFMNGIAPAVEQGYMTVDTAKALILAAVRRFKLGKVVEDTIAQMGEGQQQPKPPNPQMLEAQYKMANLSFQERQAQMDYDTKMRQMALDERGMALKEREAKQRAMTESGVALLEHSREADRMNLDAAAQAQQAEAQRRKQNLDEFKAVSGHVNDMIDHAHKLREAAQPVVVAQRAP